jgi:predicted Zn-dependent protease
VTLALTGDIAGPRRLADDLAARFPEDTVVQAYYLPTIRAAIALGTASTAAAGKHAIEALSAVAPYELGFGPWPVYMRGQAYLSAGSSGPAVAEFQKILDHPGIVNNDPTGVLAHLGLGRAYALSGDTAKARIAYQDFLALWKDADPDIPILKASQSRVREAQVIYTWAGRCPSRKHCPALARPVSGQVGKARRALRSGWQH